MVSKLHICLLATVHCFFSYVVFCHSRTITTEMNWGEKCSKNLSLVYTKAVGSNNTLHYIYSSAELMSMLAIKTKNHANLKLNCTEIPPSVSLELPSSEFYSFGIIFNQIIAYNDAGDDADLSSSNYSMWKNYSTADMIWKISANKSKPKDNLVVFEATKGNGKFRFSFQASDDDHQDQLPHLKMNSDLTLVEFTVDNVPADFAQTRFALSATYISSSESKFHLNSVKSLDDEYTPGVFRVTTWSFNKKSYKSFMQWKSVCYLSSKYERGNSTSVQHYSLRNVTIADVNSSVAYEFFKMKQEISLKSSFISFGLANDAKYYNTTLFTSWFSVIGFGEAPVEKISVTAIIIIAVGLGLPVLLIIFGGVFFCWKKKNNDYTPLYGTIST